MLQAIYIPGPPRATGGPASNSRPVGAVRPHGERRRSGRFASAGARPVLRGRERGGGVAVKLRELAERAVRSLAGNQPFKAPRPRAIAGEIKNPAAVVWQALSGPAPVNHRAFEHLLGAVCVRMAEPLWRAQLDLHSAETQPPRPAAGPGGGGGVPPQKKNFPPKIPKTHPARAATTENGGAGARIEKELLRPRPAADVPAPHNPAQDPPGGGPRNLHEPIALGWPAAGPDHAAVDQALGADPVSSRAPW